MVTSPLAILFLIPVLAIYWLPSAPQTPKVDREQAQ
jgi:hypothetical protein